MFGEVAAVGAVPFVVLLDEDVPCEAQERGQHVELVYSSFGDEKNRRFYTEPDAQARWIEELVLRGITAGCGGGLYCPLQAVSRGQMAVFLTVTFGLP